MKTCIGEANLEGQGWKSRLFTILLILTWEVRYPQQKKRVNRNRRGGGVGWSSGGCSAWEGQMAYLGKGRVLLDNQG